MVELRLPVQGVGELGAHKPQGQKTETQSRSNIVADSIKTLKIVHIKKKNLKKKRQRKVLEVQPKFNLGVREK